MWWRTQKYWTRWKGEKNASPSLLADFYTYWQGEANNSPSVLVPLADRVIEVLTWDGTRFTPFDLVANNILAAGTVAAKHLARRLRDRREGQGQCHHGGQARRELRHDGEIGG